MKRLTFCYTPNLGEKPVTFQGDVSWFAIEFGHLQFVVVAGEKITIPMHIITSPISAKEVKTDDPA